MWQFVIMNLFDSSVRIFTYLQIYFGKFTRFVRPMIPSLLDMVGRPKTGKEIEVTGTSNTRIHYVSTRGERLHYEPQTDNYGFAVAIRGENRCIIRDKDADLDDIAFQVFQVCDDETKLMVCDLNMRGKTMSLSLKEPGIYNYYVDGNVIDTAFLTYFIHSHYLDMFTDTFNDTYVCLDDDYSISIVDNSVNMVTLTTGCSMTIRMTGFEYMYGSDDNDTEILPVKLVRDETHMWETSSDESITSVSDTNEGHYDDFSCMDEFSLENDDYQSRFQEETADDNIYAEAE